MNTKTLPPNVGSNLIGMLIDTALSAAADLRDRISNVRYADISIATERKCECIYFDLAGNTYLGELRGRNRDICIDVCNTESEVNRALAVRVLLDRDATKLATVL